MKNKGRSKYTIDNTNKVLTYLDRNCNLNDSKEVETFIANKTTSNSYKKNLCIAYQKFCRKTAIVWQMPKYIPEAKTIKIPTKEKIERIIASAGRVLSVKLSISKECGLRPIELSQLKVKDVDLDQKLIRSRTAKHGNPKPTLKITEKLRNAIQDHIIRNKLNQNGKLFNGDAIYYSKRYRDMRNKLAEKLKDPSIKTIRLYRLQTLFCNQRIQKNKRHTLSQARNGT
jgi:integrase